MQILPTLFISHGSPLHALDAGEAGAAWASLGRERSTPRAILVISAHWETGVPMVTGTSSPGTIHDFGGFPKELYAVHYSPPGSPALAQRTKALLRESGFAAEIDPQRGLDHGAWVPLMQMYPQADVPVVQLSLVARGSPATHLAIGQALAPLAREGVLVIGSGHVTHNLGDWFRGRHADGAAPYATQFQRWVFEQLSTDRTDTLLNYRTAAPHALRAHPTEEHFMPLFVALGAAGASASVSRVHTSMYGHVLAMDAYQFIPAAYDAATQHAKAVEYDKTVSTERV